MAGPPQRPDLNTTEYVWDHMIVKIQQTFSRLQYRPVLHTCERVGTCASTCRKSQGATGAARRRVGTFGPDTKRGGVGGGSDSRQRILAGSGLSLCGQTHAQKQRHAERREAQTDRWANS